jgi:benzylsuccinate CoA-transferase BbsF subunit
LNYFANNEEGKRMGNASPNAAPHGVYRCKGDDRWCAISVFTDEEWRGFCKALGNPIWTEDPKFKLFLNRKKNEEELNILVEKWTSQHPAESVMSLLQNEGVPAGVVQHPEMGAFAHLGQPFGLSETPAKPRMPAPCLGEHNEYICTNILGMSDEEFVDALSSGVLE